MNTIFEYKTSDNMTFDEEIKLIKKCEHIAANLEGWNKSQNPITAHLYKDYGTHNLEFWFDITCTFILPDGKYFSAIFQYDPNPKYKCIYMIYETWEEYKEKMSKFDDKIKYNHPAAHVIDTLVNAMQFNTLQDALGAIKMLERLFSDTYRLILQ